MQELIQVSENTYYIDAPTKIGIYVENNMAYLIDSGNDKDAGRKILRLLKEKNWTLKAIINTHSNADHIGGNHYLQNQTGCQIFNNKIEVAFTKYPILETSFLYGGFPPKDLRHKFLLADNSDSLSLTDKDFPKMFEIIPLPGHFFDMIGIKTPDDITFIADSVSSQKTLEKYQIGFIYDVNKYLESLALIEKIETKLFIPSHADATSNIKDLIVFNRNKVYEIAEKIIELCKTPITFEDILQKIFNEYHLIMNFEQYVLIGSTIRSYLSFLNDQNKVIATFENNKLLWKINC